MATIAHKNLTDPELHEPKGISTANADCVYVADGTGSGAWEELDTVDPADIELPIGVIIDYAGPVAPAGWMLCYGQEISRSTYSDLFTAIGVIYGAGNGTTTFDIPDLRGRIIAASDNGAGRLTDSFGASQGTQNHMLTAGQTPVLSGTTNTTGNHTHTLSNATDVIRLDATGVAIGGAFEQISFTNTVTLGSAGAHTHTLSVNSTTTNQAHNNMQPTIIFNKIIFHGVV